MGRKRKEVLSKKSKKRVTDLRTGVKSKNSHIDYTVITHTLVTCTNVTSLPSFHCTCDIIVTMKLHVFFNVIKGCLPQSWFSSNGVLVVSSPILFPMTVRVQTGLSVSGSIAAYQI